MGFGGGSANRQAQGETARQQSSAQPDNPVQQCPLQEEDAVIVSVQFLDGDDNTELGGTGKHFVNLPRDAKWVDGAHVLNIDRLSHKPRVKVKFNKPGSHPFKVKYLPPGSDNVTYTDTEKGRTSHFKYEEAEKSYSTDGDGTKIIPTDFYVAAAGKDKYKLEAKDKKENKVTSNEIEIWRLIYYVELKMRTLTSIASSLSTLEGEFAKFNIKLVPLASVEMDHMPNVSNTDEDAFKTKARTAYTGSTAPAKQPYVVAIAYTDHLAVKNPNQTVIKTPVQVGPDKPAVDIPIVGPGLTNPAVKTRYLWKNIEPSEDWFVSAKFLRTGGVPGADDVVIPKEKCTAVAAGGNPDKCSTVQVDVTGLPAGAGSITLQVNWVDRMRGGLSFSGGNLICACSRSWWTNKSTDAQNQVIIHELGHKVGMVAKGTGKQPDKVATHYDTSKGHVGDHCHDGIPAGQTRYDSSTDSDASNCVMYGATNGKSAFCSNCQPAMRKLDICDGWSAF